MSESSETKQLSIRTTTAMSNPLGINTPASPALKAPPMDAAAIHYTCFIRLPFPRGDFVDPPQVEWNSSKDKALWKLISKTSNSRELDWEDLSARFEVSLPFLLQQAAWLYERHFAEMKAQMKKLSPSTCPSPMPPDSPSNFVINSGATAFPSGNLGQRTPAALSSRMRDSPTPTMGSGNSAIIRQNIASASISANQPTSKTEGLSRTPSTRTLTQSRTGGAPPSPSQLATRTFGSSFGNQRKPVSPQREISEPESPPLDDSDSSSDGESQIMARSQAFRRPSNFGGQKGRYESYQDEADDDDDGESSGGFLPFATTDSGRKDPAATLKSPVKRTHDNKKDTRPDSSASSASSMAPTTTAAKQKSAKQEGYVNASPASALSPRRREELSKLSPRVRREGSEGTPSMGSSFSDLDDASISQSAIEEAFMSHMQHGGTASRMSSISQALRSKYL